LFSVYGCRKEFKAVVAQIDKKRDKS
jgi:hypothetical protein